MARVLSVVVVAAAACGGRAPSTVGPTGGARDDGAGDLARASVQLSLGGGGRLPPERTRSRRRDEAFGDEAYGGDAYGGSSYAGWTVPQVTAAPPNRGPKYAVVSGLTGAIEGKVTWNGAAPGKLATSCGAIDNPTLRVGRDRGVVGVIVYIERVSRGRALPAGRPATVGGVIAKHGCALLPAAQVVTPLPAAIEVHGDDTRARVKIAAAGKAARTFELQEGGLAATTLEPGLTRVDGEAGTLVPAWVLALDTPYYAITDDAGRFRLDELATGNYELTFWQPPLATTTPDGMISVGAPVVVHRTVHVEHGKPARVELVLPAR